MIAAGTLLLRRDAFRPRCVSLAGGQYPDGWMAIKRCLTAQTLERELSDAGWTLFYMANVERRSVFGFDREKAGDTALARLVAAVYQDGCNCVQIEEVRERSLLGLPFVCVSGRPRHLQSGNLFSGQSKATRTQVGATELRAPRVVV